MCVVCVNALVPTFWCVSTLYFHFLLWLEGKNQPDSGVLKLCSSLDGVVWSVGCGWGEGDCELGHVCIQMCCVYAFKWYVCTFG